jgi:hypothetical protein
VREGALWAFVEGASQAGAQEPPWAVRDLLWLVGRQAYRSPWKRLASPMCPGYQGLSWMLAPRNDT